jgi:putative DNA primase/helicase
VTLDQTVFNAGRITKLYGTVANKGDNTLSAPWRLSRLVSTPMRSGVVTAEHLRALQPPIPAKTTNETTRPTEREGQQAFDVVRFLARLGIPYEHDTHEGRDRYKLVHCPFNADHGKAEAAIFQHPGGKLGFKCQHNSCADKTWSDVRALVDGTTYQAKFTWATGGNANGGIWPDPQPLPEGLPAVAAFDYELLPEHLQPWAQDICERVQCAPDYVGAAIMAGLGSVIGRKLGIRPQACTDWTVTANQWALVIGRPGVLKSPAMESALSPLKRLAAQATEMHKMDMDDYRRAARMAKFRAEGAEKAARNALAKDASADVSAYLDIEEPEAPALRRYIANDTTAAALGELHRQNHNGLLVFRDELVSLLKSLDREDNAEARGFYLTGWNGDSPYTFDRITRGMNLHIPAVCLSLLGSTQPGRIAEYIRHAVRGGSGDDGLIQRFGLLVWPDSGGDWRDVDRWPDSVAKREANRIFEALDRLDPANIGAQHDNDQSGEPDGLPYLRFDTSGLGLFLEWRTDLEARLRGGELHPAMESHLAKYRKLVPGLALILHLASGGVGPVSERATLQALAWAEYLETHARRAYASVTTSELTTAKAIIQRIRKGDLPQTFSRRDVWRPGWTMLSDRDQVADALLLLADLDWLWVTKQETNGRTATVYQANPRALAA